MKNIIINNVMGFVLKYNNYDGVKKEELEYGIISIYLLITKLIVILVIAAILNIFKEVIAFTLIYIPIRAVSFGMHATKSWICLIASTIMFIGLPILSKYLVLPLFIRSLIGVISILLMFKNSPADTKNRPIINKNRRLFFKYFSVLIAFIYSLTSMFINNIFIGNSLMFSLLMQCFMTSPLIYKLFNLPYNNYKDYKLS